jgi:CheY-like chemotaxis protein
MIRLALEHVRYQVETASDGQEGLAKFGEGVAWDVVLLDQRMPGMPGIEVLKEIYRRRPSTKLIMITAFGTIDLALEAIQSGAVDFLRKPFAIETLRASVKASLERPACSKMTAVPVDLVCREFTRTTINGFSFDLEDEHIDEHIGDMTCKFAVSQATAAPVSVRVILPAYVMELAKAYTDSERLPYGNRLWQAMCEEALANHLWQQAELPEDNVLRIDDLSTSLQRWLDSVMTISQPTENYVR